jgi:hypothetical protein
MPIDAPDGSAAVSDNANVLVGIAGVLTAGVAGVFPKLLAGALATGVAAPNPELLPKPVDTAPPADGWLNVEGMLANPDAGGCAPPLLAPPSFSCVRPKAAIPSTAPIAM